MTYIYQPSRVAIMKSVEKYASYVTGNVLDVGAGGFDRYSSLFKYDTYTRMDIPGTPHVQVHGYAEDLPFDAGSFDTVVCTETLTNTFGVQKAFSEMARVLRPQGILLATASFMEPPPARYASEDNRQYWRLTRDGFLRLCKENGFDVVALEPRGGYFTMQAQCAIRRYIDRFDIYHRRWARSFSFLAKLRGVFAVWRDKSDTGGDVFAMGHILVARKK